MAAANPGGDGGDKYGGARPKFFDSRKTKQRIDKVQLHKYENEIKIKKLEEEKFKRLQKIASKGIEEAKDDKTSKY
ncbi:MAG: hypothetical protein MJE68_25280 [Proteobacteria bacterium]|nr:hypothetical protein [Pseudomonadota bacterium]